MVIDLGKYWCRLVRSVFADGEANLEGRIFGMALVSRPFPSLTIADGLEHFFLPSVLVLLLIGIEIPDLVVLNGLRLSTFTG
jgi:hypothetical protein